MLGYVGIHIQPSFPHQMTPLFFETSIGLLHKVRNLVEKGADINIEDEKGVSE